VVIRHTGDKRDDSVAVPVGIRDAVALLVVQAKQGDRRAFAELYQSRLAGVGRYVGAMVRNASVAEDVVAQTFLLAWQDLPKLRRGDRFDAWLYRIAHNQAMTELRRPQTSTIEGAPEPADPDRRGAPERAVEASADAEAIREALAALPEAQREVLQLRFFQELSSGEVARRMGKTEQAVHALQYRAIANLRQTMDRDALVWIVASRPDRARTSDRNAA
jgi:RNA polymerase sigma-70 factor (ECF subfamily)